MTQSGLLPLQAGVMTYLAASTSLRALLGNPAAIYDVPPPNPVYPFILIGDMTSEEWGTRDAPGERVELSIQAFSNANRGSHDVKQLGDAIRAALDNRESSIALAAGRITLCVFAGRNEELTKDGVEWLGTTKFTIYLET